MNVLIEERMLSRQRVAAGETDPYESVTVDEMTPEDFEEEVLPWLARQAQDGFDPEIIKNADGEMKVSFKSAAGVALREMVIVWDDETDQTTIRKSVTDIIGTDDSIEQ